MIIPSLDKKRSFDFLPCPFCGGSPSLTYIGGNHTASRKIEVKCRACGVKRADSTRSHSLAWLENTAVENWNRRNSQGAT